jgi:hypothetical protein
MSQHTRDSCRVRKINCAVSRNVNIVARSDRDALCFRNKNLDFFGVKIQAEETASGVGDVHNRAVLGDEHVKWLPSNSRKLLDGITLQIDCDNEPLIGCYR